MSTPPAAPEVVWMDVPTFTARPEGDHRVDFVHGLAGPVDITAYDINGVRVGYVVAAEISPNEVSVVLVPGVEYSRLSATRSAEDA